MHGAWRAAAIRCIAENAVAAWNGEQRNSQPTKPADDKNSRWKPALAATCRGEDRSDRDQMRGQGRVQSRIRRKKEEEPVEMTVGAPPMVTDDTDTPGDGN